jgi:eukaryotic-like serine/threonine-protein kinase
VTASKVIQSKPTTSSEVRLVEVLDAYMAAAQEGRAPARDELLAAHPELAEDLEACLASLEFIQKASLTASPLVADSTSLEASEDEPGLGDLGDFRLVAEIGRGGMGVVYEAVQRSLNRRVALKVLPFAAAMDPTQLRRFQTEALAAAQLHHTHIVPVYSVGCERGVHYYAMQFIEGQTLAQAIAERRRLDRPRSASTNKDDHRETDAIRSNTPTPSSRNKEYFRTAAALGIQAAEALDHAHKVGIVHRDIKPGNLLLDVQGCLWVTDFGLARIRDDTGLTITGDLVGTLRYMSPEQALAKRGYLDHRTDIYSLGATLYELVTLQPAINGQDRQEVLRKIAQDEPTTPRRLDPTIPRELETILIKTMSKEVESRYDTAQELAADLRNFLDHRPIKARRPTLVERAAKWARRHRKVVASAVLIVILAAAGLGASVALIAHERAEAVRQRDRARRHGYVADIRQAYELVQSGQDAGVLEVLNKWRPVADEPDLRNFPWYYLRRLCHDERLTLRGHAGAVYHADFSPDGRTLVTCGQDGTVRFWEVATGRPLRTIAAHATEVNGAAFSPDGRTLATVSDDGTIKLWKVETGAEQATIPAHNGEATAVRFTPDGRRLISAGRNDCLVKLWDLTTFKELASTRAHEGFIENIALAPDGATLATSGADGYARLWNLANLGAGKSLHVALRAAVYGLAFSSDGTRLATAESSGRVRMCDLPSGQPREGFEGVAHSGGAQAVAFLAGDRMLVSGDGRAILWLSDGTTGNSLAVLNGHTGKIWGISVAPDGATFATVSSDGTVKLWDAGLSQPWLAIPVARGSGPLAFTPDGQTLIVADVVGGNLLQPTDGTPAYPIDVSVEVSGFDPKTGARRFHHVLARGEKTRLCRLTADGAFALLLNDDTTTTWEVATGKRLATIGPFQHVFPAGAGFAGVSFRGGPIELIDAVTGQRLALKGTESAQGLALDPKHKVVALRAGNKLAIWDPVTNQARRTRHVDSAPWSAAFSPDATVLVTGETVPRGLIRLWDVSTLELLDNLPGHSDFVDHFDFSPDGRVLASLSGDGVVKLWDVVARTELLTFRGPFRPGPALSFTPDGGTLAFRASADGKGWVYLLTTALPAGFESEEGP